MSLLTESQARARAQRATGIYKSALDVLTEQVRKQDQAGQHDVFLSHAYDDKELILGVALILEELGYSVYLDWRDDPSLDRKNVTAATAEKLRARMKASRCLLFSTTENATGSKWMPWELGYKDGQNTRAAVLPVARQPTQGYKGQEYLGVYPYVDEGNDTTGKLRLWVCRSQSCYVGFDSWLKGAEPTQRS